MRATPLGMRLLRRPATPAGSSTVWNAATSHTDYNVTGGSGLVANRASGSGDAIARATNGHSGSGDWLFTITMSGLGNDLVGLANASETVTNFLGQTANSVGWNRGDGNIYKGGSAVQSPGVTWVDGDTLTIRLKNGNLYFAKNGTYIGSMSPTAETGGVDVSAMGTLLPAVDAAGVRTFTADFTSWP
jgi:hypothetical protein